MKTTNQKIEIVTDLKKAKEIWNKLSTNETINDLWDFRFAFYSALNYPIRFYVGYRKGEPITLLPLEYSEDEKHFEFFGGPFMEANCIYGDPLLVEEKLELLLQIKEPCHLRWMKDFSGLTKFPNVVEDDSIYYLDLDEIKDSVDFLDQQFSSKHRKKVLRAVESFWENRKIRIENSPDISIDSLARLSCKRFADSWFVDEPIIKAFENLLKLDLNFQMLEIYVDDELVSITLGIVYKNAFNSIMSGTDIAKYSDLGKFKILKLIDRAKELGCDKLEVGSGDCGWKDMWHFQKDKQYLFEVK